jgi:hypothetical protein
MATVLNFVETQDFASFECGMMWFCAYSQTPIYRVSTDTKQRDLAFWNI